MGTRVAYPCGRSPAIRAPFPAHAVPTLELNLNRACDAYRCLPTRRPYIVFSAWWRLLLRDLDGCKRQRVGGTLTKAAVGDQAFRHRLAPPAKQLTGANPTQASDLRD